MELSRSLLAAYSLMLGLVAVAAAPWWLWQMARTGKYREGLAERLGRIPARLAPPPSTSVWIHAVSVGEVLAASRLIAELDQALPEAAMYLSTTTRTGQALARERFGAERVFYFPLDFAFAMRAWLRLLRPSLVILVESELWPRMLFECGRAGIPVAVVNARVSDRSWPRYRRLRRLWAPLLATLALVLAQSGRDADRLRSLGARRTLVGGNLKYDLRRGTEAPLTASLRRALPGGARVVVCGSTLPGEEALLLASLPLAEIVTILAPRHPERFDEVAECILASGARLVRRSRWTAGEVPHLAAGDVVLLDSIGELTSVYALATIAVVGGGFLHGGGHNPLEPALCGVPVVIGPGYANFREIVQALLAQNAVVTADKARLPAALGAMLADEAGSRELGARGQAVVAKHAGATARALSHLLALLHDGRPADDSVALQPEVERSPSEREMAAPLGSQGGAG